MKKLTNVLVKEILETVLNECTDDAVLILLKELLDGEDLQYEETMPEVVTGYIGQVLEENSLDSKTFNLLTELYNLALKEIC